MAHPARFFLKLSPSAYAKFHIVWQSTRSPRSASSATRPRRVNGASAIRARNQASYSPANLARHMPADLARSSAARRAPDLRPLHHARRRDAQRLGGFTHRLASIKPRHRAVPDIHRQRFPHASWPQDPASMWNQKSLPVGIPRFSESSSRSKGIFAGMKLIRQCTAVVRIFTPPQCLNVKNLSCSSVADALAFGL